MLFMVIINLRYALDLFSFQKYSTLKKASGERFDETLVRRWADVKQTNTELLDIMEMTENFITVIMLKCIFEKMTANNR